MEPKDILINKIERNGRLLDLQAVNNLGITAGELDDLIRDNVLRWHICPAKACRRYLEVVYTV